MRIAICNLIVVLALLGCASRRAERATPGTKSPDSSSASSSSRETVPTTQPILYHRIGGIAGTDDHVVIWPDGLVHVQGKLMPSGSAMLAPDRLHNLVAMFCGWGDLKDQYQSTGIMDAYNITIYFGGKSVTVDDIAPDLPPEFRTIFSEIESIAGQVSASGSGSAPPP